MLAAISPLENSNHDVVEDYCGGGDGSFSDVFSSGNLLEDIDFDDLFVGFDDGDGLPDLEVDPNEILGEFSVGSGSGEESGTNSSAEVKSDDLDRSEDRQEVVVKDASDAIVEDASRPVAMEPVPVPTRTDRERKPAGATNVKNSHGKRKVKVDWTPELHRRFVQAVEQLGVDKAVPSRILDIMGIDCLTRHNIASHLQKYRSHRKHLLAREAEAASWSQRRQIYGGAHKRDITTPWLAPTMGFPPPPPPVHHFRPLHVWGHPTVDHAMMHAWPKHLVPARSTTQWTPQHQPPDPTFWHQPHYPRGHMPNAPISQGTPCFSPQPLPPPAMRYPTPAVPGIPPHPMYRPDNTIPLPGKQLQFDLHPSKECVDAAIGDVLSKPWLPLPLGLKPPSVDSVLVELQRQGIAKIPPSCS